MNVIKGDRTQEIKRELAELHSTLKMSVQKAIRIGQLLTEQKEFIGHGLFLKWIEANLDISADTAGRYMKLYVHNDKIRNLPNLQTAYQQIETLEAQARQTQQERDRAIIAEFRRTGKKPDGWDRSHDYIIQKDSGAEARQKERLAQELRDREQRAQEHRATQKTDTTLSDAFLKATSGLVEKLEQRSAWKEKIRLSDGGKEDAFMDAIIDYLDTLPDDNRRIEACNNIIKICRNIAVELQRKKE
jgi:hypothetical protein